VRPNAAILSEKAVILSEKAVILSEVCRNFLRQTESKDLHFPADLFHELQTQNTRAGFALFALAAPFSQGPRGQVFVRGVVSHPLPPFVVGHKRGRDNHEC
jgi:hypothetical protein